MGVMPFLATCHACELFYCMILLFLFKWRKKISLSLLSLPTANLTPKAPDFKSGARFSKVPQSVRCTAIWFAGVCGSRAGLHVAVMINQCDLSAIGTRLIVDLPVVNLYHTREWRSVHAVSSPAAAGVYNLRSAPTPFPRFTRKYHSSVNYCHLSHLTVLISARCLSVTLGGVSTSRSCGRHVTWAISPRDAMLVRYYAVSVCLSVCPSQVGVLSKRLNVESRKQRHAIACGLIVW